MQANAKSRTVMTVEATIIRADGTREELGVIADSSWGRFKTWYINMKRRIKQWLT